MNGENSKGILQIKKYPNRRYYDATRSCHVTLQDVYDLIQNGHDVTITDSRNGEDITNLVLIQVLLEKDQPKLDLFPSTILHFMIRSNRQVVRWFIDRWFGPFIKLFASSQKQFDTYFRHAMGSKMVTPLDWATGFMNAMAPRGSEGTESWNPPTDAEWPEPPTSAETTPDSAPDSQTVFEIQDQLAKLQRQIETLSERLTGRHAGNDPPRGA